MEKARRGAVRSRRLTAIAAALGALALVAVGVGWAALDRADTDEQAFRPLYGTFNGLGRIASGEARIVQLRNGDRVLRMTDFQMPPAPELFVYVHPERSKGAIAGGTKISRLRTTLGDQSYRLPADLDLSGAPTVVIWCALCKSGFVIAELRSQAT